MLLPEVAHQSCAYPCVFLGSGAAALVRMPDISTNKEWFYYLINQKLKSIGKCLFFYS